MELQAYSQDKFIYCEWSWSRIYKKNNIYNLVVDNFEKAYLIFLIFFIVLGK